MKSFKNKLVLITGGSSGIGLALAKQLVEKGARVWILSRDKNRLQSALDSLKAVSTSSDQELGFIEGDITDQVSIERIITNWMIIHDTPDLLINSAGIAHPGYFTELDIEIFEWTMNVNYFGTVYMTKVLVPGMVNRGSGHIVNISSQAGFAGIFGYTAYSASKYAVRGFSDALRSELKPMGINMTIAFPPDTDTPQMAYEEPIKPFETRLIAGSSKKMSAEKVASSILRAVQKNQYMIIPGLEGKIFYRLTSFLKHGTYLVMDMMVRFAHKKKIKEGK